MSSRQERATEAATEWMGDIDRIKLAVLAEHFADFATAEVEAERDRCIAHLEQTAKEIDDGDLLPLSSQVELSNAAARIRYLGDHGWPDDPPRVGRPGKSARPKRVAP